MADPIPSGPFTCEITLTPIRAAKFVREDREGVTYLVARDYELVYDTVLRFRDGRELAIKAKLNGELNEQVVIRDALGKPSRVSGYVQGRTVITDSRGTVMFRGRYYDSRVVQSLLGDELLTPTGWRVVDHCENGFGEGSYAGHALSLRVQLTREGDAAMCGHASGQID